MTPQANILGTYFIGTDAYVGMITNVIAKNKIEVRLLWDIESNNINEYVEFTDNNVPTLKAKVKYTNEPIVFTKRKDGKFRERGKDHGMFKIGIIKPHLDPCF
jgi:hypothetical protein